MTGKPLFMLTRLCHVEPDCYQIIKDLYQAARDNTSNTTESLTIGNGFIEQDNFTESMIIAAFLLIAAIGGLFLNSMTL